ncbi:hypothetical protein L1987_79567 [Smallanthus sonchifolius]|uniref:Uncharacterized protein n=1 Tax=Smallanthus sonchifolius TaxID=185202 RepID=A0ACB8ZGU7_9ASTR|nr:hypothetical protein L1987_79567 [Smallanthus sonchifolius]
MLLNSNGKVGMIVDNEKEEPSTSTALTSKGKAKSKARGLMSYRVSLIVKKEIKSSVTTSLNSPDQPTSKAGRNSPD